MDAGASGSRPPVIGVMGISLVPVTSIIDSITIVDKINFVASRPQFEGPCAHVVEPAP